MSQSMCIMSESILNCVVCKNETPRKLTFIFDIKKTHNNHYTSIPQNFDPKEKHMRRYICRTCHFQLQTTFLCVCWIFTKSSNRNIEQHLCKQYNVEDYDFQPHNILSLGVYLIQVMNKMTSIFVYHATRDYWNQILKICVCHTL